MEVRFAVAQSQDASSLAGSHSLNIDCNNVSISGLCSSMDCAGPPLGRTGLHRSDWYASVVHYVGCCMVLSL